MAEIVFKTNSELGIEQLREFRNRKLIETKSYELTHRTASTVF